jgi:O-antigen/teichoic acid export membrane protein
MTAEVIGIGAIVLFSVLAGRFAGKEWLATYSALFAFLSTLRPIIDCGFDIELPRSIADSSRVHAYKVIQTLEFSHAVKILLWLTVGSPILLGLAWWNPHLSLQVTLLAGFWLLLRTLTMSYAATLRGLDIFSAIQRVESTIQIGVATVATIVLLLSSSLMLIVGCYILGELVRLQWYHYIIVRYCKDSLTTDTKYHQTSVFTIPQTLITMSISVIQHLSSVTGIRKAYKTARSQFSLTLTMLCSGLQARLSVLLLTWLISTEALGVYTAAFRFLTLLRILPGMVMTIMIPDFSRHATSFPKLFRAALIACGIGSSIAFIMWFLADFMILLSFGTEYQEAVPVLQVLSMSMIAVMPAFVFEAWLLAQNYERFVILGLCISIIITGTAFITITDISIFQSAMLVVAGESIICVGYGVICARKLLRV